MYVTLTLICIFIHIKKNIFNKIFNLTEILLKSSLYNRYNLGLFDGKILYKLQLVQPILYKLQFVQNLNLYITYICHGKKSSLAQFEENLEFYQGLSQEILIFRIVKDNVKVLLSSFLFM